MAFSHSIPSQHIVSGDSSNNLSWYDSNQCHSYPATVQGSSETKILGVLLYSGSFINTDRLDNALKDLARRRFQRDVKLGCRLTRNTEITKQEGTFRSWIMAKNQMVSIEVDVGNEQLVKQIVYVHFNKTKDPLTASRTIQFALC